MKQLKLFLSMLMLICFSVGQVWAALPENPTWEAKALADIADGSTIIIISNSDAATNIALPSITTGSNPAKVQCEVATENGVTTITAPEGYSLQDLAWTVSVQESSWKFFQEGSEGVRLFLNGTGSNTALRVGTAQSSNDEFVMGDLGNLLKVTTGSRFVGPNDNGGTDWRTYNTENANNYKGAALTFYVLITDGGSTSTVATPVIYPADNQFENELEISINCTTEGADIYYTLDGSDPDANATLYENPFTITATTTVKAIAFKEGNGSSVAEATYTKEEPYVLPTGYYLIGQDGWTVDALSENLLFQENSANSGEYMLTVTLVAGQEMKVVKVEDNTIITWFPDGNDNNYAVDAEHAGEKTIYFRPEGYADWYAFHEGGFFYIAANEPVVAPTEPYTLKFNGTGTSSDSGQSLAADVAAIFTEDCKDLVASVETANKIYAARMIAEEKSSLKLGTTSVKGALEFTLAFPQEVDYIIVNATQYGDNASEITVNGTAFTLNAGNKVPRDCKFVPSGELSTIKIEQSSSERLYLRYITIYPKGTAPIEATISADNIALGEVETEDDVFHKEVTLSVTGANLTSPITYASSNPDVVAVSGELTAEGGELTVVINAPASAAGLALDETITLTSGETVLTVAVTANVKKVEPAEPLESGYYLIGQNGWDKAALNENLKFQANTENEGEYFLNVTLFENQDIKVVEVASDEIIAWFPAGETPNYTVDASHAGNKTVYFRPEGNLDWVTFHDGGFFYIEANEVIPPAPAGATYKLVTSADELVAGAHYVIGTPAGSFMSTESNNTNRRITTATVTNNLVTATEAMMVFTLGGDANGWTFATENYAGTNGYLNATDATGSNYLKVVAALDAYAYFSIAIEEGVTTVACTGKDSRHILYQNGTTCFACYNNQTSSQYTKPSLFKMVEGDIPTPDLEDGFYLIGQNGWDENALSADLLFQANTENEGEYFLSVTLEENQEIKVVEVEDNAIKTWFPGGETPNYAVDAEHAGEKVVYFRPEGWNDWYAFHDGGFFYIEANAVIPAGAQYKLVTSADELVEGAHYVIGTPAGSFIATTANNNNRKITTATVENDIVTATDEVMVFTLGGDAEGWTFATENYLGDAGYLNATSTTGSNNLKVVAALDEYAYFTIAIEEGVTTVTCTGKESRNILYQNGNTCFSCYNNQTAQQYIKPNLYKLVEGDTPSYPKYFLKNNWGEGIEWTWKETTRDEEGIYHLPNVVYGGTGINFNTVAEDEGEDWGWIEHDNIQIISSSKAPAKLLLCDTVNLVFDPNADPKTISAEILNTNEDRYDVIGNSLALFINLWQAHPLADYFYTRMKKQDDGTFKLAKEDVTLPAGDILYKVVKNADAANGAWPSENAVLTIPSSGIYDVTFYFNPSTKAITVDLNKKSDVNIQSLSLFGGWDEWTTGLPLLIGEDNDKALVTLSLTAAHDYEFKLKNNASDDVWLGNAQQFSRGDASIRNIVDNGDNMILHADVAGDYLFTFIFETNQLIIQFPSIVPTTKITALNGEFSVSDSKKVNFSRGNLQYNYGEDAWYTAETQYEVLGDLNLRLGDPNYQGSVDLFSWSCESSNFGTIPSYKGVDFTGDYVEWGEKFGDEWFTLDLTEFKYLLDRKKDGHSLWTCIALGQDSIIGLALFPDDWTAPEGIDITYGFAKNDLAALQEHAYTLAQWAEMEAAGAVFLPAGGSRAGVYGSNIGFDGASTSSSVNPLTGNQWYCWISSPYTTGYYWLRDEPNFFIYGSDAWGDNVQYGPRERYRGHNVRLVTEAVPPTYTVAGGSTAIFATAWDATDTNFDMTLQEDGTYQLALTNIELLTTGTYEYKVVENHDWAVSYPVVEGDQNANFEISEPGRYDITFIFDPSQAEDANCLAICTLRGGLSVQIKGSWQPWVAPSMKLSDDSKTASRKITLAAGDYAFIITCNNKLYGNDQVFESGNNVYSDIQEGEGMTLRANVAGDYIFTWTFETHSLEVTFPAPTSYNVIGSAAVFGLDWGINSSENEMVQGTFETYDYQLVLPNVTLAADIYEYKIVKDHSWTGSVPSLATNAQLEITTSGRYKITFLFNSTTKAYEYRLELLEEIEVLPTVHMKGDWDDWASAINFVMIHENQYARASYTFAENQTIEFKMYINSNPRSNGEYFTEFNHKYEYITENMDPNMILKTKEAGTYTFTWEFVDNSLDITYPGQVPPDPTAVDDVDAEAKAMKVLREGNLFIIKSDKIFNAQGMKVK